jgi:hypothetical protein
MAAYSENLRLSISVSLNEMTKVSPVARAWISGFLSGSEPAPPYFADDDHATIVEKEWLDAVAEFTSSGWLPAMPTELTKAAREKIAVTATRATVSRKWLSTPTGTHWHTLYARLRYPTETAAPGVCPRGTALRPRERGQT